MTAICLSGGGANLAVHFGACQALYENGLDKPTGLFGTSAGAIVCAFLAGGREPREGLELAKKVLPKHIIGLNWKMLLGFPFMSATGFGLFTLDKLEKVLKQYVPHKFGDCKIPLYVTVTNLDKRRYDIYSEQTTPEVPVFQAVRASSSVPFLFETVIINGSLATDGGVTNNYPIDEPVGKAIGIRLLSSSGDKHKRPDKPKDLIVAVLGSMMEAIEREHISDADVFSRSISVKVPHNSMDFWDVDAKLIEELYEHGYHVVLEKLKEGFSIDGGDDVSN